MTQTGDSLLVSNVHLDAISNILYWHEFSHSKTFSFFFAHSIFSSVFLAFSIAHTFTRLLNSILILAHKKTHIRGEKSNFLRFFSNTFAYEFMDGLGRTQSDNRYSGHQANLLNEIEIEQKFFFLFSTRIQTNSIADK